VPIIKLKFWLLIELKVLQRVKSQLNYPESEPDLIRPQTILTHVDKYSMGTERKLEDYLG